MPEFVTAIDYADNPNDTTTNMIDVRVPIGTRLALQSQPAAPLRLDQIDLEPLKAELSDPAKAKAFLQRGGFLNASGELAERYGGKPEQPAAAGVSDAEIESIIEKDYPHFYDAHDGISITEIAEIVNAILALRPQSESERVDAIMAHVHDLYAELGLKWGDNPFLALSRLRPQAVPMTDEPKAAPKLIGWRTENFLWETDDVDKATPEPVAGEDRPLRGLSPDMIVSVLIKAAGRRDVLHAAHMGKAMSDEDFAVFSRLRDRDIPALRHELVARMAATPPQQAAGEPVVWIQPDHLQKARVAPHLCRVAPTRIAPDFVPMFTHPAPGVPEGFALVPVEPTREMNRAGFDAHHATGLTGEIWRAMLAAAQAKGGE